MPVRRRKLTAAPTGADGLREELLKEWRNPDGSVPEPIIIEEAQGAQSAVHLFVIWSRWAGLSDLERSEIIMGAFEELRGPDQAMRVSVAMGLTQDEAKRLRIDYE